MPEPLKNLYTEQLVANVCAEIKRHELSFSSKKMKQSVFSKGWKDKALKARMSHIAVSLKPLLPEKYNDAVAILKLASQAFSGFEYMFFPDFVERYGLNDFDVSMSALACFTEYASAEFAVRPFIVREQSRMMQQMKQWALSDNHHIRRLASEGCRPRLPWAMALPEFKKDPQAVLELLELLKQDPSEYVRRSVANNLNDIAKDHPQAVLSVAKRWQGLSAETDKLVKHACRTLLKQGNADALALFGFKAPKHVLVNDFTLQPSVALGGDLAFSFVLQTNKPQLGLLRVEYAVDFMKKNGK
ncbi:MAG: DNA alkylation repair protein, partial [Methylococcales bacterium]|nr:DNA alkylation repair protein [Methylococcales bacterium]